MERNTQLSLSQSTQISQTTRTSVPTLIEKEEENVFQKSYSRCCELKNDFFLNATNS